VTLVREPRASGGVSNAATSLTEIGELDGSALATLAARHGRALARRTGRMVDHYGSCQDLGPLRLAARLDVRRRPDRPFCPGLRTHRTHRTV
jgi:hypothetical protein